MLLMFFLWLIVKGTYRCHFLGTIQTWRTMKWCYVKNSPRSKTVSSKSYYLIIDLLIDCSYLLMWLHHWFFKCGRSLKKENVQLNIKAQDESRGIFFRVTCGETSKIIFNLFPITFSTCVFWSQHAFPPLLSPFNRWLKHMEICLSLSQIKCNNEKNPPIFGGWRLSGDYI